MDFNQREQEILRMALDKFQKTTGIPAEVRGDVHPPVPGPDAVVQIGDQYFAAEVKVSLRRVHVAAAIHELANYPTKGLIITRYVTPQLANYLKELDIAFIDTAGNAYVNEHPIFVFVRGERPKDDLVPKLRNRAFQPAGLKLIFAFLCNPGLETHPYREIANKATVALGTVNWIMKDLVQMGYILEMGKRGRRLRKKKELLNRWVTTYPEALRPKQMLGRYKAKDRDWWQNIILPTSTDFNTCWGAEIAATKLTGYLTPMTVTIYTDEPLGKFTLEHRLKKEPQGEVEILKPFWKFGYRHQDRHIVPPILVYADLLAAGDPRNIETAKVIYDQELLDLSEKIDPDTVAILEEISRMASSLDIPFYVVGARARDFVLFHGYDIHTIRATSDIDLAIQVSDWDKFNDLKAGLIATGKFEETRQPQRIVHASRMPVDIIPFGGIADESNSYAWPTDKGLEMNVLGFEEAYNHSLTGTFRQNPKLDIKLVSPAGLTMLKIIAWGEGRTGKARDAQDLFLLMKNYIDVGNLERFYNEINSFKETDENFDYECASARMLGRDIANIATEEAIRAILNVLDQETESTGRYNLIMDIQTGSTPPEDFDTILRLLEYLRSGIRHGHKSKS